MSCKVIAIDNFKREAKRLAKKFPSLRSELAELEQMLLENPRSGAMILPDVYKIRLAVKSTGKGKSGGMRVVTYVLDLEFLVNDGENENETTVFLTSIYDKSEMENISDGYLQQLIHRIREGLG